MAQRLKDTSVDAIERCLDELQVHDDTADQRTSVLTHMAWVPPKWSRAAGRVLEGMGARVPSRTILLHPDPGASADRLDAEIDHECFPEAGQAICAEIVHVWLRGRTAKAPASVVVPLQLPDLPVFLRWRGKPPFGKPEFGQLLTAADRLVVDSGEWDRLPAAYRRLAEVFDRIVVSDLAWARTLGWRAALADLWPGIKKARTVRVTGPAAEAALLGGWLRSRLKRKLTVRRANARALSRIEVDGVAVEPVRLPAASRADQLSNQLELYVRDPVYEAAVRAV